MKKVINIKTKDKQYKIFIQQDSIIRHIQNQKNLNNQIFIIIDNKISYILDRFKKNKKIKVININGSEKIKSMNYYSKLINQLLKLKIDRHSTLIAIGGGTIGDLSGFIASTVLRGVNFILIPTTLLSQVDSSIGGKNGINTLYGKNLIGTFYQPNKVIIDPKILYSLPKRELRSGYAEILKHALINDKLFYRWLNRNCKKILNLEESFITKAIIESIKIKSKFVQNDEREILINSSSRAMLNFGHTFGHALETMNNYNNKLSHGEAISIGMAFALKISNKMKYITNNEYIDVIDHLKKVNLPYFDKRINSNKIFDIMLSDKKNANDKINLILLKKIGFAYYERGLSKKEIKKLLS